MTGWFRARLRTVVTTFALVALVSLAVGATTAAARTSHARAHHRAHKVHQKILRPKKTGGLDCNGESRRQRAVHGAVACTDIRGRRAHNNNVWNGRFYDNGVYIGHDEPDMTFLSNKPGSGDNVTWNETLGTDPSAMPTVATPGSDVTHWFELSVAPWFSMAMCDPNSYPESHHCNPESDSNARSRAGSAFMEMQLYPPGFPPFADGISCDDSHWCAALTIDSLECTSGFAKCNTNCEEPVNFAFIQQNGVPTGPANPQNQSLSSYTPNSETLLMNPGDHITVHMYDAPVPGSRANAFEVVIDDLTTGQTGYMQASAANGFANTNPANCDGTPYNFEPEFSTASPGNYVPWAALQTNISTEYEIGHFEPCSSVSSPGTYDGDTYYNVCNGPYESNSANELGEPSDAFCFPAGDTHPALGTYPGDEVSGCLDDLQQNGDLDYDGTPYYADWPTSTSATSKFPGSFAQSLPSTAGTSYTSYFDQTDAALSEPSCTAGSSGCTVPPQGPGGFYPYWSRVNTGTSCQIEFGNVSTGTGVNDMGQDAQYGSDQYATLGYDEFEGPVTSNSTC